MLKYLVLGTLYVSVLAAEDVMVQRMQSVVDEVIELRERYESAVRENQACMQQISAYEQADATGMQHSAATDKNMQVLRNENERLSQALEGVKQQLKGVEKLQREVETLEKENKRLNTSAKILIQKNHSLLTQVNNLKRSEAEDAEGEKRGEEVLRLQEQLKEQTKRAQELKKENDRLQVQLAGKSKSLNISSALNEENRQLHKQNLALQDALQTCQSRPENIKQTKLCEDDNPFPTLLMKEDTPSVSPVKTKKVMPQERKKSSSQTQNPPLIVKEKGSAYRVANESAIYDAPSGKVVEIWEEMTSFTSNIYKGKWIKITGYFVDQKWQKARKELWVKAENTIKR